MDGSIVPLVTAISTPLVCSLLIIICSLLDITIDYLNFITRGLCKKGLISGRGISGTVSPEIPLPLITILPTRYVSLYPGSYPTPSGPVGTKPGLSSPSPVLIIIDPGFIALALAPTFGP